MLPALLCPPHGFIFRPVPDFGHSMVKPDSGAKFPAFLNPMHPEALSKGVPRSSKTASLTRTAIGAQAWSYRRVLRGGGFLCEVALYAPSLSLANNRTRSRYWRMRVPRL